MVLTMGEVRALLARVQSLRVVPPLVRPISTESTLSQWPRVTSLLTNLKRRIARLTQIMKKKKKTVVIQTTNRSR